MPHHFEHARTHARTHNVRAHCPSCRPGFETQGGLRPARLKCHIYEFNCKFLGCTQYVPKSKQSESVVAVVANIVGANAHGSVKLNDVVLSIRPSGIEAIGSGLIGSGQPRKLLWTTPIEQVRSLAQLSTCRGLRLLRI